MAKINITYTIWKTSSSVLKQKSPREIPRSGAMSSSPNWGKGKNKQGLTWHHHEDTKRLVLVDYNDHRRNYGLYHQQRKGGRSIWGGGRPGRRGKLNGRTGKPLGKC